ncbi:hypothetical protein ACEQPO_26265 [Bacillus sp. SL00103]
MQRSLNQTQGDGSNATKLANIQDLKLPIGGNTTTIQDYYQNVIAEMGFKGKKNMTLESSSAALSIQPMNVECRRVLFPLMKK